MKQVSKRKALEKRCPACGSSQIHYRKFLDNWKCRACGHTFRKPKKDEGTKQ